jgi:hypothetical protein
MDREVKNGETRGKKTRLTSLTQTQTTRFVSKKVLLVVSFIKLNLSLF